MALTPIQYQSVVTDRAGQDSTVSFNQFNNKLGTLTGITLTFDINAAGAFTVENLASAAATVTTSLSGYLNVELPSNGLLWSQGAGDSKAVALQGFDGLADFLGASTATGAIQVDGRTSTATVTLGTADIAAFSGTGTIDLTVNRFGSSTHTGSVNWLSSVLTTVGGTVGLQYEWTPTFHSGGIGSSGVVILQGGTLYGGSGFGSQTTVAQSFTFADDLTGWTLPAEVAKFDPTLGLLMSINIGVVLDAKATVSAENLSADSATVYLADRAQLTAVSRGTTLLSFEPRTFTLPSSDFSVGNGPPIPLGTPIFTLDAFDGLTDFAGSSGRVADATPVIQGATASARITTADLLARFTGTGTETISVGTAGNASFTGGGNMIAEVTQRMGGTLTVSYTYAPAGSELAASLACFAQGTRIATIDGPIPVEALRPGLTALLADGSTAPIIWIGQRAVDCARHPDPGSVHPIRVARGAFASGVPSRDLYLSPDHAILDDGVLIPIRHLVNGTTIRPVATDHVRYFHVELPQHAALLAEGLAAESYLDTGDRASFSNGGPVTALHPLYGRFRRDAEGFAPLVVTGPRLAAARTRLDQRAHATKRSAVRVSP